MITKKINGRNRRLFRLTPGGNYHVRFQVRGKDCLRSTGTDDEAAAKKRAEEIIKTEIDGNIEKSRALKLRSDYSTLDKVAEIYIANYGWNRPRAATARKYVSELAKMIRTVHKRKLEDAHSSLLTEDLVHEYQKIQLGKVKTHKSGFTIARERQSALTTTSSEIRHVRAIFAHKWANWYKHLALPDLTGFRQARITLPKQEDRKPIAEHVIDAVLTAGPQLEKENPQLYPVYLCFMHLGMRNCEIKQARRSWLRRTPELESKGIAAKLHVVVSLEDEGGEEGEFFQKGTGRRIPIAPATYAALLKNWKPSPDGDFLIPAAHKTARYDLIYHDMRRWCANLGIDETYRKRSYELRALAGSFLYKDTKDLRAVQKFLGHANLTTTERHYHYLLDETPPPRVPTPPPAGNVVKFAQ